MAKSKTKFSQGQLNRASEILGNLAVAWFTAGVISPLLIRSQNTVEMIVNFVIALTAAGISVFWSMYLMRKVK